MNTNQFNANGGGASDQLAAQMGSMNLNNPNQLEMHDVQRWCREMTSADPNVTLEAVTCLRKSLCRDTDPPIEEVINTGSIPILIRFLIEGSDELKFQSLWAVTNILSGNSENVNAVLHVDGSLAVIMNLIMHESVEIRSQAVWALGNIAGDCPETRDLCIHHGAAQILAGIAPNAGNDIGFLRNLAWATSNMMRGKPPPSLSAIEPLFGILYSGVNHQDSQVRTDSLWSLAFLSDGIQSSIAKVLEICPNPVAFVQPGASKDILSPVIRVCGNITTGSDLQTQKLLDCGWLQAVGNLLCQPECTKSVMKECLWALSNILAGSHEQIQAALNANVLLPTIQTAAGSVPDICVQKEALYCITNLVSCSTVQQLVEAVKLGAYQALVSVIDSKPGEKIVSICVEGIHDILLKTRCFKIPEIENFYSNIDLSNVFLYADTIPKVREIELLLNNSQQ